MLADAKTLGITMDGKTDRQLMEEVRAKENEAQILADAKVLGIETADKTLVQLQSEIRDKERESMLMEKVASLGISTEGKTTEQIQEAVKAAMPARDAVTSERGKGGRKGGARD